MESRLPQSTETPAGGVPNANAAPSAVCPNCGQKLIDPGGLGWCRACGFCRSLEDERAQELLAQNAPPPKAPSMTQLAGYIPIWCWVLLGGVMLVFLFALGVGRLLPAGNTFPRALWTSVQVMGGLVVILAAQFLALTLVAAYDDKLGFKDVLVPTRLWAVAVRRLTALPRLAHYLCGAAWGVALILSALIFIGGLGHWFSYLPNSKAVAAKKAR